MTKSEIRGKLREIESAKYAKEIRWREFKKLEDVEFKVRDELDEVLVGLTGQKTGIVMIDGEAHQFGEPFGVRRVPIIDLDVLVGSHASDSRCVKSINPHLNPADLEGVVS